jgi:hypothetical protein
MAPRGACEEYDENGKYDLTYGCSLISHHVKFFNYTDIPVNNDTNWVWTT